MTTLGLVSPDGHKAEIRLDDGAVVVIDHVLYEITGVETVEDVDFQPGAAVEWFYTAFTLRVKRKDKLNA